MDQPSISDSTTVVAARDLLATELGEDVVILNLGDGIYYSLDEVGARIWQMLASPVTLRTICDTIEAEYDVARAECEQDVRALVGTLASRGLVDLR